MTNPTPTPPGVALLADYLERENLTNEQFAARDTTGRLDRPLIGRLLSGERAKRVSVNLARAIELASNGAIPIEAWETPTAPPDPEGPVVVRDGFDQTAEVA